MTGRFAIFALVVCGWMAGGPSLATALEYARCAPTRAVLYFDIGTTTVRIDATLREAGENCDPVANANVQRPSDVTVHYLDKIYPIPESCLRKSHFDIDGVEVEPGGGYLRVWLGRSMNRAEDILLQEREEVLVLFNRDGFVSCKRIADYLPAD